MIYEVRTYTVKPRSLPEVVKRFGEKYEQRKKYSELAAFFQVEVGPLNQLCARFYGVFLKNLNKSLSRKYEEKAEIYLKLFKKRGASA